MAITSNSNHSAPAVPQGIESDHSLPHAEGAAESRAEHANLAAGNGVGESLENDGNPTSDNELPAVPDALKAERRRSNQLEKEIRSLKQQLNRFSEINPEEYARLQEAEKQKQKLEKQLELRERLLEEASARKVAAVAAERDAAAERVLQLLKERLLERAFSEAEGLTGVDGRSTFFDVIKGQLWETPKCSSSNSPDRLEARPWNSVLCATT